MKKNSLILSISLILISILISSCNNKTSGPIPPQLFNNDWQFILSADSTEIFKSTVTLAWENVKLPHTPVIEPLIVNNQWQGIYWYRKDFSLPEELKDRNLFIRFEGAMNVAEVWINGVKKITHLGGYLPFVVDFTNEAKAGETNQVIVKLDNRDNPITGPKPLKQLDFNMYGGLYRDVFLIIKNNVYISDPIFENTPDAGMFVTYPAVSKEKAIVRVQTHVKNTGDGEKKLRCGIIFWNRLAIYLLLGINPLPISKSPSQNYGRRHIRICTGW
jgi:beta-galactosidase